MLSCARATRGRGIPSLDTRRGRPSILPSERWENSAEHFGEKRLLSYPRFLFPGLVRQVRGRFVDSHVYYGGRHKAEAPGRSTYLCEKKTNRAQLF